MPKATSLVQLSTRLIPEDAAAIVAFMSEIVYIVQCNPEKITGIAEMVSDTTAFAFQIEIEDT